MGKQQAGYQHFLHSHHICTILLSKFAKAFNVVEGSCVAQW